MRYVLRRSFIIFLVIALTASFAFSQDWVFSTIDSSIDQYSANSAYLVLDTNSIPNVFIFDINIGALSRYYLDGDEWIKQDYAINFGPTSVVVDDQNCFHLCCRDFQILLYLYISEDSVTLDTVVLGPDQQVGAFSIAVDLDNNPHIVYYENNSGEIRHAYRDENGWTYDIIDIHAPNSIARIKLLSHGNILNAYAGAYYYGQIDTIWYYRKDDNNWTKSRAYSTQSIGAINMQLNSSGNPGLFYSFTDINVTINAYLQFNGSTWDFEFIDYDYRNPNDPPFDFDTADNPHFIQYTITHPDDPTSIIHTYRHLSGWQRDTILTGFYYPLAMESDSNIFHFVYRGDPGLYYGRLDIVTDIEENTIHNKNGDFQLSEIYPNPFNSVSTIIFTLDKPQDVKLTVYDLLGRQIEVLIDQYMQSGMHRVVLDASSLTSGVYFYRLRVGDAVETKRMVLLK